jgi:hypothetical protein
LPNGHAAWRAASVPPDPKCRRHDVLAAQGAAKRNPGYAITKNKLALKGRCTPPLRGCKKLNATPTQGFARKLAPPWAASTPSLRDYYLNL